MKLELKFYNMMIVYGGTIISVFPSKSSGYRFREWRRMTYILVNLFHLNNQLNVKFLWMGNYSIFYVLMVLSLCLMWDAIDFCLQLHGSLTEFIAEKRLWTNWIIIRLICIFGRDFQEEELRMPMRLWLIIKLMASGSHSVGLDYNVIGTNQGQQ